MNSRQISGLGLAGLGVVSFLVLKSNASSNNPDTTNESEIADVVTTQPASISVPLQPTNDLQAQIAALLSIPSEPSSPLPDLVVNTPVPLPEWVTAAIPSVASVTVHLSDADMWALEKNYPALFCK